MNVQFKSDMKRLDEEVVDLETRMALVYEEGAISAAQHKQAMLRPVTTVRLGGETLMILSDSIWNEIILPSGFPALAPVGASDVDLPVIELEIATEVCFQYMCILSCVLHLYCFIPLLF